ncbi:MAG TPA: hypothetical protein VD813_12270, partial [Pseudonocardia sp.]|nr:hypothetical protein [Pseudonocardia sp.]
GPTDTNAPDLGFTTSTFAGSENAPDLTAFAVTPTELPSSLDTTWPTAPEEQPQPALETPPPPYLIADTRQLCNEIQNGKLCLTVDHDPGSARYKSPVVTYEKRSGDPLQRAFLGIEATDPDGVYRDIIDSQYPEQRGVKAGETMRFEGEDAYLDVPLHCIRGTLYADGRQFETRIGCP